MKNMNKLVCATVITVMVSFTNTTLASDMEFCKGLASLANTVMSARQSGVPMTTQVEIANGDSLVIDMIKQAYHHPKFGSDEYQKKAATEFSNMWFMACLEVKSI